jgi:hypothetical protein
MTYGHWDVSAVGEFDPKDWFGFLYEIEQKSTGRTYIGKKFFTHKRQKTKANKSRTKESDWAYYTSSSESVNALIDECGKLDFEFRIVLLCSGRCMLGYEEESYQRARDVLRTRLPTGELKYLNRTIGFHNFAGLEKQTLESHRKTQALVAAGRGPTLFVGHHTIPADGTVSSSLSGGNVSTSVHVAAGNCISQTDRTI